MHKYPIKRLLAFMVASMMIIIATINSGSGIWGKTQIKALENTEYCDINEDGSVTTIDLILLVKMIIGTESITSVADIDGDGKVDSKDFIKLKNVFLIESEFDTIQSNPQNNEEENSIYCKYLYEINFCKSLFIPTLDAFNFLYYSLYDINSDGIYELIMYRSAGEVYSKIDVYTIDVSGDELIAIGDFPVTHSWLSTQDNKLFLNTGDQGYYSLTSLEMNSDSESWVISQKIIREESELSDYPTYGTDLRRYDLSDTSAIESLCPKELLDDAPHVEGHTKVVYGKNQLYLSGNCSSVLLHIYSDFNEQVYN